MEQSSLAGRSGYSERRALSSNADVAVIGAAVVLLACPATFRGSRFERFSQLAARSRAFDRGR
jgi:hypothetical protein